MRLKNRVAIVTGGNTGIGFATSVRLAREGARVLMASLDSARGAEAVAQLRDEGLEALFVETDVTKRADAARMVDVAIRAWGRVDVLFSNAGYSVPGDVVGCTEEEWDRVLDVELKGSFLCSKYVVPAMVTGGGGAIIINSSEQAIVGSENHVAHSAAKGGLISLTRAMAMDHAADNIRVNCICPGSVATETGLRWFELDGAPDRQSWLANIPLGRLGRPDDIAEAVLFLASDDARWMTGTVLVVDGGYTAH